MITPLSPRDAYYQQLRDANVGEPAARRAADAKFPALIVTPDAQAMRDQLEAAHEAEADRLMQALGFEVVRLSQRRASKVTAGVPDRRYYHRRRRLALWVELKAEWGEQRPAQREFQLMCDACGDVYVLGRLAELQAWLVDTGVATWHGAHLEPTPIDVAPIAPDPEHAP